MTRTSAEHDGGAMNHLRRPGCISVRLIGDDATFHGQLAVELSASAIETSAHPLRRALIAGKRGKPRGGAEIGVLDVTANARRAIGLVPVFLAHVPVLKIVVVHAALNASIVREAIAAGATGIVSKTDPMAALVASIQLAAAGGFPLSRGAAALLMPPLEPEQPRSVGNLLTKRELAVLEILSLGATYREAAAMLCIGQGTVETHVKRLYRKLGANNRSEALRFAVESGGFLWNVSRARAAGPGQSEPAAPGIP